MVLFAVVEGKRAKEFEPWSAIIPAGFTDKLKGFLADVAEREAVLVEIVGVVELGGSGVKRNNGALESALAEQEIIDVSAIESGVGDESIAVKGRVAFEESGNEGLNGGGIG